jgi:hypothetical protein
MSHIVPVLLCLEQQQVPLMPRDIVVSEPYLILVVNINGEWR